MFTNVATKEKDVQGASVRLVFIDSSSSVGGSWIRNYIDGLFYSCLDFYVCLFLQKTLFYVTSYSI